MARRSLSKVHKLRIASQHSKDVEALEYEARREYAKLRSRIAYVRKKIGNNTYAEYRFKELGGLKLKDLSESELRKKVADIKYVLGLHSTKISGARHFEDYFKNLKDRLDKDENFKKKFFTIYEKSTERGLLDKNFKYKVMELVDNMMNDNYAEEKIFDAVDKLYEQLQESRR